MSRNSISVIAKHSARCRAARIRHRARQFAWALLSLATASSVVPLPARLLLPTFTQTSLAAEGGGDSLRQKQQAQEKARQLARELVSSVLEVQLRQLKENGLDKQPVYRDIREMQGNVDAISKRQMEEVVQLLVKAQEGSQKERLANFNSARDRIRDVVVELMGERQKLHRRLRVARVQAQVEQLISLETKVLKSTRSLTEETAERRDSLQLSTIADQTDIGALYLQLLETLTDLTTWSGDVAASASEGMRILKAGQVDQELKSAVVSLKDTDFATAAQHEQAVIKGLRALLQKLEETRGLISSDREAAIKMVQEMMKKQEKLREQTKQSELTEKQREELVAQQTQIQEELGQLAQALEKFTNTQPLLEQAKQASQEATRELFEEQKADAVKQQSQVIGNLAEVAEQLRRAVDLDQSRKSSEQLAAEVKKLEKVQEQLKKAIEPQREATALAEKTPDQARAKEQQVEKAVTEAAATEELPATVKTRLEDAAAQA
ncbi:MAG: hypothetical protein ACKOUR_17965, partial [Planctomycetota bacterium]